MESAERGLSRELREIRTGAIAVAVAIAVALIVDAFLAFGEIERWRAVRGTVLGGWVIIAGVAILRRARHRLAIAVALMAGTLAVANLCLLMSTANRDTWALAAHLLRAVAYLLPLIAMIRLSTAAVRGRVESENRFRAYVNATSNIVYRLGPDWKELRQLEGKDIIVDTQRPDRAWLDTYIHPDDQPLLSAEIERAIRTKTPYELEHRVRRVDGSLGWVFSRAIPLLDERGEITEWFGAASDITPRRLAEERSRAQLARLHLLGDITRAISDRLDASSIFRVVLRTLETELPLDFACICRHEPGEPFITVASIGVHSAALAAQLGLAERARIEADQNGLARCLRGMLVHEPDVSTSAFPFPALLSRGGLRSVVFAPLSVDGRVVGMLVAARKAAASFASVDCEFLRQLCEHLALAANQAQLHESLLEAYEDLRESQQVVLQQERLRALGQLASGIAHDINNALTPAALYTQSLLEHETNLGATARERLTIVNRAIEDVGGTVARLRTFYRPRDAELTLAPLDFNQLARQVIELTRVRWKDMPQEQGIHVELATELEEPLPRVMGAESEIRDALTNLVLNAVDAMSKGGALTVRTKTRDRRVSIEVSDTGAGMSEAVRARCLEPFFTTKGERGSGLGLAMVYGMVQRHSAELEIDSELGKGTTMRLVFPVAETSAMPTAHVPAQPAAPMRLLLVDDDPVLLQSLQFVLASDGHLVTTADGGRAGIAEFEAARARGEPYALVITDLGMPKVDGRAVAAAIKTASPRTPVVLLTGWGQRLQDDRELPPNIDAVLSKPPRISDLRSTLSKMGSDPIP